MTIHNFSFRLGISVFIFACFFIHVNESKCFAQETQANITSTANQGNLKVLAIDKVTKEPLSDVTLSARRYYRNGGDRRSQNTTDENGECNIRIGEQKPSVFRVKTSKQGYVPIQVDFGETSTIKEIPGEYTIALEQGTTIGGIIQDEQGNPISGASVFILIPNENEVESVAISNEELKTDANGIWKCDYVPADLVDIWIRLAHPDYTNDDMYGQTPKPSMERLRDMTGIMVMKKGLVVKGRVLDTKGQPVNGASVSQGSDRFGSEYPQTRTDEEGNFIFNNAKSGEIILTVQKPGYAPDLKQIIATKNMDPIEFRLEQGYTIKGRIVDPNGKPIAGAFVAADTWRGHRSLEWRVNTNNDGIFQWNSAPSDEVFIDMGKQGCMSVRKFGMTASDEEYKITMYPSLKVHGSVVDAETGQPINNFKLIGGIDWGNGQPVYWQRENAKSFKNGQFEISFSEPRDAHFIKIEADNYKPGISIPFHSNEIDVTLDFKLEKGQGLKGIVKLPDGTIAEGADVVLCTPDQNVNLQNGRIQYRGASISVKTKENGEFSFPDQESSFVILILHDNGYIEIPERDFTNNSEIILQPWSKVEGKLLIGKEPGANKTLRLLYDTNYEEGGVNYYNDYSTTTDNHGNFTFNRVIPGNPRICREVRLTQNSYSFSHSKKIEVKAGETLDLTLGGTGQAVIGKINVPDYVNDKVDIEWFYANLAISSPNNLYTQMSFRIESDGLFSIDDVPEGSYTLKATAHGPSNEQGNPFGETIGNVSHAFTISELPGGRSDEPLDLGTIELQITNKESFTPSLTGKAIPDINDFNIDSKQSDMKDKSILICFWDMEQRPSRNCILELNKKINELEKKDVFVIAIQASKTDEKYLNDWIKEYEINIPMAFIESDSEQIRFNWGVKALPWLILTDKEHIVQAEGFSLDQLDENIEGISSK